MTDITERLRSLYVQHGTDYVQEAADEIERLRAERDRALDRISAMAAEIERLRAALDKLPGRITPDEEDGEPDYYADGWNDAIDAMMAIRGRSNERPT